MTKKYLIEHHDFCRRNNQANHLTEYVEKDGIKYIACWSPLGHTGFLYSLANGKNILEGVWLETWLETEIEDNLTDFAERIPASLDLFIQRGYKHLPRGGIAAQ